ncbi:MAG: ATP-binding protein [Streptosporangiaceae bacterium]|nr:ATP-binding protein [Streptosporangiaceae bacterium]
MSSPQPWQVLSALPAWHVTEVSRPEGGHASDAGDQGAEERVAALASAYGCDAPITVAWIRDRPGGPVRVLAGGPALAGGCDGGQAVLTLPSGARGIPLGDGEAARTLAALPCWTRIAGVTDVLLAEAREQQPGQQAVPPSLERGLLSAWLDAFAWLLLAEPADPGLVTEMAADVARAQLEAEQYHSPRAELAARRSAARHNELREAGTSGLWRVHLLAGAATADAAARVARLVAASADLRGLPYGLAPRPVTGSLPDTLIAASGNLPTSGRAVPPVTQPDAGADRSWWDTPMTPGPWDDPASADSRRQWPQSAPGPALAEASRRAEDERDTLTPQSPFYASTRLVATLARAPARELPGLRFTLRPQFDVTPETTPTFTSGDSSGVTAGTVLDANRIPAGPITLPLASLNRHVFVTGATGAGKSQTIRGLLEQAAHTGIPWLVVEPAKAEYRLMAARLRDAQVIRIRPGDLDVSPAGLNPLEPARGPGGDRFPLQAHADLVRDLFLAAFQADEPFPQVLAAALTRCYEQAGWDMVTGAPTEPGMRPAYPGLEDLQATALQVVEDIGYGREVADNVRGFVQVRIHSLRLGTSGRFLDGGHPLDFGALLNRNVVFEIEDAGDDHDKAFLMGAVLIRLTEHLRLRHRAEGPTAPRLRHLTVIEEAHRLLRQPPPGTGNGPAAHAVEMFADLLAEVRAYGEGLIIAEQIPAKLIPDAIKNTAVKVVHRLPAADDRETVGATMNLTESQSQYLVTLVPGEAAVFADGMDYPILARMPDGTVREITTTANAESPAALVGRRSVTCGPDCLAMPCTLRQMRAAQNTAERDPRIILWAELSVLAHLTGWTMPVPGQVFAAALDKMDQRLRDCALSHTVDAAIAARAPAITTRVDGPALAIHIVDAMRARLDNGRWLCASEEPQWLAPPYRWAPLLDHLRDWCADHPGGGPHPSTRDWEAATGRVIPSDTSAAQLDAVQAWHDASQRDSKQVHAALFGTRPVSAIEQAIGARADHPDWTRRLADAFTAFLDCRWPIDLLRAAT